MVDYTTKVILNKKNNQLSVVLNRKKLKLLDKNPKKIKLKGLEVKF